MQNKTDETEYPGSNPELPGLMANPGSDLEPPELMGITFNPITKPWYNTNTNQTVTGLPNPPHYIKDICY
jgi:hypothetical protein